MWMLWRIEYQTRLARYASGLRFEGENTPQPLDYPGKDLDERLAKERLEANKAKVRKAYGL